LLLLESDEILPEIYLEGMRELSAALARDRPLVFLNASETGRMGKDHVRQGAQRLKDEAQDEADGHPAGVTMNERRDTEVSRGSYSVS
jgi:hypothetical protein